MNDPNQTPSEELLKKVKKLMALGSSPSEAEAASALEKARVLLARYGLSLADVDARQSEIVEGVLLEKKRLRTWEHYLVQVITQYTFTQALTVQRGEIRQILIIGREVNTVAASELFAYLHRTILILARAHSEQVDHLDSFRIGAVIRIGERLAAMEKKTAPESGTEPSDRRLTVLMAATADRENSAFIGDKYGKTRTKKVGRRVHGDSYDRGLKAGEGISLHKQIKGK